MTRRKRRPPRLKAAHLDLSPINTAASSFYHVAAWPKPHVIFERFELTSAYTEPLWRVVESASAEKARRKRARRGAAVRKFVSWDAFAKDGSGFVRLTLDGKRVRFDALSIIWCLWNGDWPDGFAIPLDGDGGNMSAANVGCLALNGMVQKPGATSFDGRLSL